MLTKAEAASRLDITEGTLVRWAKYGLVTQHACDGSRHLYEAPGPNVPAKQCSRWNHLADRAAALENAVSSKCSDPTERAVL